MRPRFQADNDLRSAIRRGVKRREPAIDFKSSAESGLDGVPDAEVLQIAAREGRILVSHDENSMPAHFYEFLANNSHSPGLLMVPQDAPIGAVVESIVLVWLASEADEWLGKITWLPL